MTEKEGYVLKSGGTPDTESLTKINRFTRREFQPEELYTFPVALCDNEIDRDGERFTVAALEKLAELFVGKTGIFDHNPKAEHQTARIYDCSTERVPGKETAAGEPYIRLVARAYLPKTAANADLITELDGGIKKEVSVGCAVSKVTCSVCGADLRAGSCEHARGQSYGGKICCAVLDEPTDAYEWSFVAVPAQREAGVLKHFTGKEGIHTEEITEILKGGAVSLTGEQSAALLEKLARLEREAACGRAYRETVKKDFIRYASLAKPELPAEMLARTADGMSLEDLKCFEAAFRKEAGKVAPLTPQLGHGKRETEPDGNEPFRI